MEKFESLYDLTGQESGLVVYADSGEAIFCNWAQVGAGFPRLSPMGDSVLSLGGAVYAFSAEGVAIADLGAELDTVPGLRVIYDRNGDAANLAGLGAVRFLVASAADGAVVAAVYAPDGWN